MLRGYLDHASRHNIRGWALDEAQPGVPLQVVLSRNGEVLTRVLANRYREDVEALHGAGRHGFDVKLPGLCALRRHVITARVEGSDTDLMYSPIIIEPAAAFDVEVEASLARLVAGADVASLERTITALAGQIEAALARDASLRTHEVLRHFRYRWFRHRGPEPDETQNPPPRALIVDSRPPDASEDGEGDTIASYALSLRRLGYDVAFVPADLGRPVGPLADSLERAGVQFHYRPFTASVEELLRRQQGTFALVIVHRLGNAFRYGPLIRHYCSNARLVHSRPAQPGAFEDGLSGARRLGFVETMERQRRAERATTWQADAVATADEADAERLRELSPGVTAHVVPWSVPVRPTIRSFERRRGAAFLGLVGSPAVLSLMRCITAAIWTRNPDVECLLREMPGMDPSDFTAGPVVPIGADIADHDLFDRVRLTVVLSSTGQALRHVATSLGAGVPCVAPPQILRELGAPASLIACDTSRVPDLAQTIVDLHDEPARNAAARKIGLDLIDSRYSSDTTDAAMRELVRRRHSPRTSGFNLVSISPSPTVVAAGALGGRV